MSAAPALSAAFTLAEEYGLPVFPCRSRVEWINGEERKAKRPLTQHGFKDASANLAQIEEWWQRWPDALIGVPTGRDTKLLVVDIDPAGLEWYRENAARLGAGRTHKTRRGFHLLYRLPADAEIGNSTGELSPGVDVRGIGGYVVWWPAHGCEATGGMEDLAEPPQWLINAILAAQKPKSAPGNGHDDGRVHEGGRNYRLSREAYRLRKLGSTVEQILTMLRAINEALCDPPLSDDEVRQIAGGKENIDADKEDGKHPAIVLRHVADIVAERREARWLGGLHKILECKVLAVLAGSRNTFKSFIAHHWAMTAAINGESVIILSAEGAGLDRRTDAWMRTHAPAVDLRSLKVLALERAVNLNAGRTLEALHGAIGADAPTLIVVDTYSKYAPGLDENDNAAVALYLASLGFGLRDHYLSTVLLVAHAGHGDARRPRGASALMSNPDSEYIVERSNPTVMAATVTRERFKDSASLPPLAYSAQVVDLQRLDSHGEPVTSLVLFDADVPAVAAAQKPELHGKAQRQLLAALRANATDDAAGIWTLADMREIGRKAGLNKSTARSAAEALTFTQYLTATVGGWRLTEAEG